MDVSRLAAIPLFAGLPEGDLTRIASVASELDVATGTALASEGEFGHSLFVVEAGTADVLTDGRVVRRVGPGDVVGEIAVVSSGRRTATVVATSPMKVMTLFKRDVWALERNAPEVAERLQRLVCAHRAGS